ncbi:hypothetical protein LTR81_025692 [Elasticomyces elasticus]
MVGVDDSASNLLQQIDWKSLGKGVVVYICATHSRSTSQALLQLSHPLAVIVQTYESASPDMLESSEVDNRLLAVQLRSPTELQPVRDAVMYVLQPGLSPLVGSGIASRELLTAELHSHLSVLQANPLAILIVAPTLLPEANSGQVDLEVQARLQDFAHMLLNNESAWEVGELMKLVDEVFDKHGRLVVVDRLQSAGCATVALVPSTAHIYASARESADKVVATIKAAGSDAVAFQANVREVSQTIELFDKAVSHFGKLDIAVSSSGVVSFGHLKDVTEEEFNRVFSLNTRGQFFVAREV